MLKLTLFIFLFLTHFLVFSQTFLTGQVVDNSDQSALPGATITNRQDSLLAVTDEGGNFKLEVDKRQTLYFRYIGFEEMQVSVSPGDGNISVALIPQTNLLQEVKVEAYESYRPLAEVAGGISLIQKQDLQKFDQASLVPAINQVPGVRMEQRSTGSYRISIRGSALRSPFDVRNIKVYWNNIPITEPGGNTPFNLLDNSNINNIEILKGPSGSIYGAGIGGVVNIKSENPFQNNNQVKTGYSFGSFGMSRQTINAHFSDSQKALKVSYAKQKSDGYRDHSAFERQSFHIGSSFKNGNIGEIRTDLLYTDLFYEIPGGLKQAEYDENPRQARPGNPFVLGSEASNASISVKNLLAGITYDTDIGENFNLLATAYTNIADFVNPFNLDYKREAQQSYGGRARVNHPGRLLGIETQLTIGGEYQYRFASARNYGNNLGMPDTLNFDDELRTKQYLGFAQYEVFFPKNWILTTGLSSNNTQYDIYRLVDSEGINGQRIEKKFETQWMPRVSLVKTYEDIAFHGSVSFGFSPPTLEEVRTNEGSINVDLQPEKGINYEAGVRGSGLQNRLTYDVTFFYLKLDESIVDSTSERGTDIFLNAGSINQRGVESTFGLKLIDNPYAIISALNININYAYHDFAFKDYVGNDGDNSGNKMTGVAPNTLWTGIEFTSNFGLYGNLNYNYTDEIPLNNENEVFADSYHLMLAKIGYSRTIWEKIVLDVHAGVDNLLNQKYSLGNDLNPFGGRFYQPAPERNYYGGVSLSYSY